MQANLRQLVIELCRLPKETTWVEFKHNNSDPMMIGRTISALANSAALDDKNHAYMVWGIDDGTHEVIGTTFDFSKAKKGAQELENWLRSLLSNNANFEHHHIEFDDKEVEILIIDKALLFPVSFQDIDYIRVGSYTKNLIDKELRALQGRLWGKLHNQTFEACIAKENLNIQGIFNSIDVSKYFDLIGIQQPLDIESSIHYLLEDQLVIRQDNGLYSITNLGAILFAKKLSEFNQLKRKALRVIRYEGLNKFKIISERSFDSGYGICFENAVELIGAMLPAEEDVNSARLSISQEFPIPAIREAVANSLIHQDFFVSGAGPVVEIFTNRVEVTNPGTPLVNIQRIIDNPPKSRNEKLASLMRRLDMCEELGRGWDRMVLACELKHITSPRIDVYEESTRVSVFSKQDFSNIPTEYKLWSLYLHACVMFVQGEAISNKTVRERFGLKESSAAVASRLIRQGVEKRLIKPVDEDASQRYIKYCPFWS